jgi:pyridoxal phosphate phosphatase PHOSPHO2
MCSEKSLLWIFSLSIQGLILNSIQGKATSGSTRREVIYIGDGGGDFCPSLQLQKGDHVLARKG